MNQLDPTLAHVDAAARALHTTVLRTSESGDLFVQLAAAAVIRAAQPHLAYRYGGPDADLNRMLGLTVGEWTITPAAVDAATGLLRQRVAGQAATDTELRLAAIGALRAALHAR